MTATTYPLANSSPLSLVCVACQTSPHSSLDRVLTAGVNMQSADRHSIGASALHAEDSPLDRRTETETGDTDWLSVLCSHLSSSLPTSLSCDYLARPALSSSLISFTPTRPPPLLSSSAPPRPPPRHPLGLLLGTPSASSHPTPSTTSRDVPPCFDLFLYLSYAPYPLLSRSEQPSL